MANSNHLLWLDLETTGLKLYNSILEIAIGISHIENPFHLLETFNEVVHYNKNTTLVISDVVQKMHNENNLWLESEHSQYSLEQVEQMTIDVMKKYDNSFIIAGANCWFDLAFIGQYMPKLYSYIPDKINHFDVSAMEKYACMKGCVLQKRTTVHRALGDIYESIERGKHCIDWLK